MARTLILGALLGGLALTANAEANTATNPCTSLDAQAQKDAQGEKAKGDEGAKKDAQDKKKDAKTNKITVWTLDATGKG
ncbi:MAG: hypothetical protein VXW31_04665 [Planctomycetota bacterium]|nr:hypothetical protein [Planctomycetota bacterium]